MLTSRLLTVFLVATLIAGCFGGVVQLPGAMEEPPLVTKLDVSVGSHFPGKSRAYMVQTPVARIAVGEASAKRFRQAWDAMFTRVVDLPDWPPWRSRPPPFDGVIELDDVEMDVTLGNDLDEPDHMRVRYRVCLYRPDANLVKCWSTEAESSYQRGLGEVGKLLSFLGGPLKAESSDQEGSGECVLDFCTYLGQRADHVMREAIARFLLEFEADPDVKRWARHEARQ